MSSKTGVEDRITSKGGSVLKRNSAVEPRGVVGKIASKTTSSQFRRQAISVAPGIIALIVTAFTEFTPINPGARAFLVWTPFELTFSGSLVVLGMAWINRQQMKAAHRALDESNRAEQNRRAIAAIGIAASWDLDLDRLYQRVSQDLTSIIEFDRLTITSALPTGRMRVEYVQGATGEGYPAGAVLPETPDQPDGLSAEFVENYGSQITAAIPACNGTLTIRSRRKELYGLAELDLLRQVVAQISPGVANAIMFQATERQVRERTVLAEIGLAATSGNSPRAIIEAVDASLNQLIDYDHLGLILAGEQDKSEHHGVVEYWSQKGLSGWNAGDQISFDPSSATQGSVVQSKGSEFALAGQADAVAEGDHRTWLSAPLFVQEQLIGVLVVSSPARDALGEDESALLLSVSLQIAPAIQNANLTAALERRADERRIVAAIGLAANSELNLDAIYRRLDSELAKALQFDRMSIKYLHPDTGQQEIVYTSGIEADGLKVGDVTGIQSHDRVKTDSCGDDWSAADPWMKSFIEQTGLKSRASAPLGTAPNLLGRLNIASLEEGRYDAQDVELLERIAIQITPAIRNARMIAAERDLRETLDRQNRELYEANNARKQFLSTVSHELKTPLTIIAGFVDLLATPGEMDDEQERQETLGIIRRNAEHLDVLINDILDISRLDAGTFKINPQPFSMSELVSDLDASFQSLLRTKAQTLVVDIGEDELWINADRSRIGQVITNLLSNASKYSPEKTEVMLSCHVDGQRLRVAVADQGQGMTEEEQKGLFTAFFRADNETTRSVPGTGLGLVIAKSITELHGGEIRLSSEVGKGTTIEFWLPDLTTKEAALAETPEQETFGGSRLWPDGPPEDIGLGAD